MGWDYDEYPDPRMLDQFPNWIVDESGESRFVIQGGTVKPLKQAERIDVKTDFTAADVWFADGRQYAALIKVADIFSLAIIVFDEQPWVLERLLDEKNHYDLLRFRVTNRWQLYDRQCPERSLGDPSVFPLSYCTRLDSTATGAAIYGAISSEGLDMPWTPQ